MIQHERPQRIHMYKLQSMPQEAESTSYHGSFRETDVCILEMLHAIHGSHPLRPLFRKNLRFGWMSITLLRQCTSLHEDVSFAPLSVAFFPQGARARPAKRDRGGRSLSGVEDELPWQSYEAQGPGWNGDICRVRSARQTFAIGTMAEEL